MPGSIPAARQQLIEKIAVEAKRLRDTRTSLPVDEFVRVYYRGVDEEDLASSPPGHFAAAAASHLAFGSRRAAGVPLVRVFNPDVEKDGWKSGHTVVEVVTDDMPFLVDSLAMVLGGCGLAIHLMAHPVLHLQRDKRGLLRSQELRADPGDAAESWQHVQVDRISDPAQLEEVRARILRVLDDVRLSVQDWTAMRRKAMEVAETLHSQSPGVPAADKAEAKAFLEWLADNHFTFLGYREYRLVRGSKSDRLVPVARSGLGLMRPGKDRPASHTVELRGEIRRRAREATLLIVTKANSVSTVHRATYLDYVGIKVFDSRGRVTGERRFIGLFTSSTYSASPREIPLLRHKVRRAIDHFGISPTSHDGKALMHVLETHPRDELFQSSVAELVGTARGIVNLYERRRVRLFVRRDPYRRFFSCLLFVPRDRYNTQVRERIERVLLDELAGTALESRVQISESMLARIHTLVRTDAERDVKVDVDRIEARVAEAVRTWSDRLREALIAQMPEDKALELAKAYGSAFPTAYQEEVAAVDAIGDIVELQALPQAVPSTGLNLRSGSKADILHLRLYRRGDPIAMSDMLPLLENFDLRILNERPYRVTVADNGPLWIQDLEVTHAQGRTLDPSQVGARFEDAFFAVWNGHAESDGFNRLVLGASLNWRQAELLRAICRYLLQTGLPFSQRYMEQVLARNPEIASRLAWMFETRFDPAVKKELREARLKPLLQEIETALDRVTSPDDDRILRAFRSVIDATLRTNRYQRSTETGALKPYLSLKLDPKSIPELPKPRPMFEVWVYSPRMEGVHLRMGKVARGGIRWSDRREDFRTEILGLMKAQNVKNTLIVPVGAKGGFVPKRLPHGDREAIQREGVECYRLLIRGLLDITDNVQGGTVVPPVDVVRYDPDDPYMVVAADKGTASFSDIANALSAEYSFWLGDAFASGGSAGYDHKKMGITARGAWECVKRHFREMGIDTQSQEFTVAGIGDMAGDVFGNGLLSSRHIRMVAAFNHQHIFIDPSPDPERSFRERERLFSLPRSTWNDYDRKAISAGGGVFPRDAKELTLSTQARALLGLEAARATPSQVVRAILKLPVDLLWNGGIGTYVKASWEAHSSVGDRSNDAVRVDGKDLRCRVIGEGGNLGLSQLGRIEYALHGGRLNTDFVDNSGGVDCSDHEVNIKILLDVVQRKTGLKRRERDKLLAAMTDDVAALVLRDNYLQSQAISLQEAAASERLGEHTHLIRALEVDGLLDRALEYLPSAEEIEERRRIGRGLTRPELAMLLSYSKIALYNQLMQSDVPEDPYLSGELDRYFPDRLGSRYSSLLREHRLRREIIATATTNSIVNRMGPNFVHRTQQDTGTDAATVARAYSIAREAFDVRLLWGRIEKLDNRVAPAVQYEMIHETVALIRQVTYWLIQRHRSSLGIEMQVARLRPGIHELERSLVARLSGVEKETFDASLARLSSAQVPLDLARSIAALSAMQCAPDVVELAQARKLPVQAAGDAYFGIGSHLGLDWIRRRIESLDTQGHWHAVARGSLREALYQAHRNLVQRVLSETRERDPAKALKAWEAAHALEMAHARGVVNDIRAQSSTDFASLSVALQAFRRLAGA